MSDPVRDLVRAMLYEGYMLWPYRRDALKNQRRWTFGGVFPRAWTEAGHEDDACRLRAECLVEVPAGRDDSSVRVCVRFLHIVERRVAAVDGAGLRFVDALAIDGERHVAWEEAAEREVWIGPLALDRRGAAVEPITVAAGGAREWLHDRSGRRAGAFARSWSALRGAARVRIEPAAPRIVRVSVTVTNDTDWSGEDREVALRSSLVSTHVALHADGARFVSLTDPPPALGELAGRCRNEGCWPVLVGDRVRRDTVLAAPIILSDFPQIAPESPGDLFDGGEIDELLVLNILGLTDSEQAEMRAADPRTREILERTRSLTREQMMGLHGTFRDVGGVAPEEPA